MSDPAQSADDESPGHQRQGHDGEDPVKQSLQSNSPRARLRVRYEIWANVTLKSVTFFLLVLLGMLMLITVVRTISPLSSDKLASKCLWSSLRQYFTNSTCKERTESR